MKLIRRLFLFVLLSGCDLPASQISLLPNSPHEARARLMLNEIWEPGCFEVYIVQSENPSLQFAAILFGRVLINERFANSLAKKDTALRAVLAHEVAHGVLGHVDKRRVAADNFMEGASRLVLAIQQYVGSGEIRPVTISYMEFLPHLSTYLSALVGQEIEADAAAVDILRGKGFDPQSYIVALESLPADFEETNGRQYDELIEFLKILTERINFFSFTRDSTLDAMPPYPTIQKRLAAVQDKLSGTRAVGTIKDRGCPHWPSNEELINLATREKKRQDDLAAKARDLELALDAIERQGHLKPPLTVDLGEKYRLAKSLLLKSPTTTAHEAIPYFEEIVWHDPRYKDTLTLLGRAYYYAGRYEQAYQIVQRALAVNKTDEIAWLVIGFIQVRRGDEQKGLEALKGGITLLSRVSVSGYRGFPTWDATGSVRSAIQRCAFYLAREAKQAAVESCELLLRSIDTEESAQETR